MSVRMDEADRRDPGFIQAFAPVGFALAFVLCCFALPVVAVLALLRLSG